jgi:TonB family protein
VKGAEMKYIVAVFFAALLILPGCAGPQRVLVTSEGPELISMTPFPPVSFASELKLNVMVHIQKDGSVGSVKLLSSSGNHDWDSLAVETIKQWRYTPPRRDDKSAEMWLQHLVIVQIQEPIVMTIGELAAHDASEADSLFALLQKGTDLDSLFKQKIGTFDIGKYPSQIREKIKSLKQNEFTAPLRVGDLYFIYKRFRTGAF